MLSNKERQMKIAFHSNAIDRGGCSVAVYDYAYYNRELLKNESIVFYDKNNTDNYFLAHEKFNKEFEVYGYNDWSEVDSMIKEHNIDVLYTIKSGNKDGKISNKCKTVVHAVFQDYEPHGDVYAYISEWLSSIMGDKKSPFVPFMIDLPKQNKNMREDWGIPSDAVVFGRHGTNNQFNISAVQNVVELVAKENESIYFVFLNTDKFCEPTKNIIFLEPICDVQEKSNFINSCDAMLHARTNGESFGAAVAEFLFHNKPVISWRGGNDQNHISMLGDDGLFYSSINDNHTSSIGLDYDM